MSLSKKTVYNQFREGKIKGFQDPETLTIYLENPLRENQSNNQNKVVLYARVSSSQNKSNLDTQLERLSNYASAKGYQVIKEVKEVGSGLNDNRKKLNDLISKDDYEIIIVEHKDRLTRFGFNYLEQLFALKNQKIEVINYTENDQEDLMQDFIAIITSFCACLYGKRLSQRKIESIIKNLTGNKND